MYSKQEASLHRQSFWTAFGRYMAPVPNADGTAINWINYHTGVKHIYFRMDAGREKAVIGIELSHPDLAKRHEAFDLLEANEFLLREEVGEPWHWHRDVTTKDQKTLGRIFKEENGVNIFNREDWPRIISFFKPRIIALDQFWQQVKPLFE